MCWYHLAFLTGPPLISKCMRSFFRSKRVMIARSPGLTEGPQIASSSFSFCSSGEILPPFIVSPTLPIGNWVRMNTKSELKVRINSIRCCSVSCEESLLEARDGRLWKKITMTRRTRRGRIQTHPNYSLGWQKQQHRCPQKSTSKRTCFFQITANESYLAVKVNLSI